MRNISLTIDIECQLDDEYFLEWDELPDELLMFWEDKGCNCEGSGVMGTWCDGCPFNLKYEVDEVQP